MRVDLDIVDWASISPLSSNKEEIWQNYLSPSHKIVSVEGAPGAGCSAKELEGLHSISKENNKYKSLDKSVLMAIHAARQLQNPVKNCGINIGSSRGATALFESHFTEFQATGQSSPLASPSTTLGNLSSWVAQDLMSEGISLSHSITCSTALHSIANAAAWLNAGFSEQFIAGGSEAPLTPFTISQMQAMRIYAETTETPFPCKAFDLKKIRNTMVLGEGSALFLLSKNAANPLAKIESIGFATEAITHGSSISDEGQSMRKAMSMALDGINPDEIDTVVMHAPGTIKGDQAELNALKDVFQNKLPFLTTNKWKIGHTLGASGALSLEFALLMILKGKKIGLPWNDHFVVEERPKRVLINAVGFGGNAVSVVLKGQ